MSIEKVRNYFKEKGIADRMVCYPSSRHFKYRKIFGFCRPVLGGIFMLLTSFYHDTPLA